MNPRQTSKAIAKARTQDAERLKRWVVGSAMFVSAALVAGAVFADSHENMVETHAYSTFGNFKYRDQHSVSGHFR